MLYIPLDGVETASKASGSAETSLTFFGFSINCYTKRKRTRPLKADYSALVMTELPKNTKQG